MAKAINTSRQLTSLHTHAPCSNALEFACRHHRLCVWNFTEAFFFSIIWNKQSTLGPNLQGPLPHRSTLKVWVDTTWKWETHGAVNARVPTSGMPALPRCNEKQLDRSRWVFSNPLHSISQPFLVSLAFCLPAEGCQTKHRAHTHTHKYKNTQIYSWFPLDLRTQQEAHIPRRALPAARTKQSLWN